MSGHDATYIQCMTRRESLRKGDCVYIHGAQDENVKDLVRAAPDVKFPRSEALWSSQLQLLVRAFVFQVDERRCSERANLPHKD